jgi:hypothetical protein
MITESRRKHEALHGVFRFLEANLTRTVVAGVLDTLLTARAFSLRHQANGTVICVVARPALNGLLEQRLLKAWNKTVHARKSISYYLPDYLPKAWQEQLPKAPSTSKEAGGSKSKTKSNTKIKIKSKRKDNSVKAKLPQYSAKKNKIVAGGNSPQRFYAITVDAAAGTVTGKLLAETFQLRVSVKLSSTSTWPIRRVYLCSIHTVVAKTC